MFGFGPTELIIIAVIVLLLFGAKRLPEIGKGLGGAVREFKKIKKDLSSDQTGDEKDIQTENKQSSGKESNIEAKVREKVLEQVPGVKKVADAKKKIEKAKDLMK